MRISEVYELISHGIESKENMTMLSSELTESQEQSAKKIHADALIVEMHSDVNLDVMRCRGLGQTKVLERLHLPNWKAGGVNAVIMNTPPRFGLTPYPYFASPVDNTLQMLDALHQEIEESHEHLSLVLEPDDILAAQRDGKVGIIMGVEGSEAFATDLGLLRSFYRLGLRVVTLTWHQRNLIADGVSEQSDAGLSNFGRLAVQEMNRLGIMIDVSHVGKTAVRDVLKLSTVPIMASHSNARAVHEHERNLEDSAIKRIAEKGGVVGVVFLGRFVAETDPSISDVLRHVDYMRDLNEGTDHIGIGPDYVGGGAEMVIGARRVVRYDDPAIHHTTIPYAEGLEDSSKLINFTRELFARGYAAEEIRAILGENFLRFFRAVRNHKTPPSQS